MFQRNIKSESKKWSVNKTTVNKQAQVSDLRKFHDCRGDAYTMSVQWKDVIVYMMLFLMFNFFGISFYLQMQEPIYNPYFTYRLTFKCKTKW